MNIKGYSMQANINNYLKLEDRFYMIELSKGIPIYDSIVDKDYDEVDKIIVNLIYNAPKSILEKLATITEYTLIIPSNSEDNDFYLYSYRDNSLIHLEKNSSILYSIFKESRLDNGPSALHFGLIIASFLISDGFEKASLNAYIKTEVVDCYTLENEEFGIKEVFQILKDIRKGKYRKSIFSRFISYIKSFFKK